MTDLRSDTRGGPPPHTGAIIVMASIAGKAGMGPAPGPPDPRAPFRSAICCQPVFRFAHLFATPVFCAKFNRRCPSPPLGAVGRPRNLAPYAATNFARIGFAKPGGPQRGRRPSGRALSTSVKNSAFFPVNLSTVSVLAPLSVALSAFPPP